jgi:hypothetical protein
MRGSILLMAAVAVGCGGAAAMWKVERAAFDLSCSEQQMRAQVLVDAKNVAGQPMNGAAVGYTGCGKKATYVYVDDAGWVMNSPVQSQ